MTGKKHKKAVEWQNKKEEARTQGIYVRGFPPWATQVDLKKFFSQFGDINDFIYGSTHAPYVIVQYASRFSAEECLSRPLHFHGWRLFVSKRRVNRDISSVRKPVENKDKKTDQENISILTVLSSYNSFEAQLAALIHELELTDTEKFAEICRNLEYTFSKAYSGCKAHPFGSSVTGLAFKGSDMDVFMDLNIGCCSEEVQSSLVIKAKKLLYQNYYRYYTNIIGIPKAKTPIVKFIHMPTNTSCDLSFKNALGVQNSALIKYYLSLDDRLRPLLMVIKYWAKKNDLSGTGKLTHYALVMLVIFYLQQLSPPIVPTVYCIRSNSAIIDGWECSFDTSAWSPQHQKNSMSIPELVTGFLKFCSEFEYELKVICPLIGESVPKSLFQFPEQLPKAMDQYKSVVANGSRSLKVDTDMCIQDPYELTHNLTAGLSLKKLRLFTSYCAAAAKVCSDVLSSECELNFLQKLLDDRMNVTDILPKSGKFSLIRIYFRKNANCNIMDESELHPWWFKAVFEFVVKVFSNILKFDVNIEDKQTTTDEAGQSLRKIQKLDGQADVGKQYSDIENETKIHCSGKCRIWEGRKATSKKMQFAEGIDPFIRETILSDFLMNTQKNESAIIKLTCIFKPKQEPTLVELELINGGSSKGDFISLSSFLQGRLPRWVELGVVRPQEKQDD